MKRIAFSVWPDLPGNKVPEALHQVRAGTSVKVLTEAGFEVTERGDLDTSKYPILGQMLQYNNNSGRFYTKVSDYIRLLYMKEYFQQGYDEVLYFDYDYQITEAPTKYGICFESHLETEDGLGVGPVDKLWLKGANGVYYLSKYHIDNLDRHLEAVERYLVGKSGNAKFCYPMSLISPIEDEIGYIPGYYHFGSLKEPNFCTLDNILELMVIHHHLETVGDHYPITGMNFSSIRDMSGNDSEADAIFGLNDLIKTQDYSEDRLRSILSRVTDTCRIRPNYGSAKGRSAIRNLLNRYRYN